MSAIPEPSYADLTYKVLIEARRPLTFQELFEAVNLLRPVTTRDPKATIRNALTQGRQLVNTGNGRYWYLPHLLAGSLLRLPLIQPNPANHALVYPDEVRQALWPSFLEIQKRQSEQPVQVRLPGGGEVALALGFLGPGTWGCRVPDVLRGYLAENRAAAGDSLLLRVVNASECHFEAWLERARQRDAAAVAARNRELSAAVEAQLRKDQTRPGALWDIVIALLARGFYKAEVAPDALETVLKADRRFVYAGMVSWVLAEAVTPEMRAWIRRAKLLDVEIGASPGPGADSSEDGDVGSLDGSRHVV